MEGVFTVIRVLCSRQLLNISGRNIERQTQESLRAQDGNIKEAIYHREKLRTQLGKKHDHVQGNETAQGLKLQPSQWKVNSYGRFSAGWPGL